MSKRDVFLKAIRDTVKYWEDLADGGEHDTHAGVAFSILTLIDGCSEHPSVDLFVGDTFINEDCHLHEFYYEKEKPNA